MKISEYISNELRNDYSREEFDAFLAKIHFKYDVPSIHIAGTNGKGSTASYLYGIYRAANYRVGLFTSPSFYHTNEMIKVDDDFISDNDIKHYIDDNLKFIKKYQLSEFEITTFVALSYFKDKHVDVAIIECGMGGEVDATNVFTPILSIITSIAMEHTSYLGHSIYEIAAHKAGIIKEDVPVLIGELNEEAESTIAKYAKEMDAPLFKVGPTYTVRYKDNGLTFNYANYINVYLSSFAAYSAFDASIAIEAINILKDKYNVSEDHIRNGLASIKMNARFEYLGNRLIVDGAHNVEAIKKLVENVARLLWGKRIHIVFASFNDKNISLMLPELAKYGDITLTTFDHVRARTKDDYFLFLDEYKFEDDYLSLINNLLKDNPEDIILVTGSLAFAYLIKDSFDKGLIKYE